MQEIINYLDKGDYASLSIVISIFIFVWLYKTILSNIQEKKKIEFDFVDNSIQYHCEALKQIRIYKQHRIDGSNNISKDDLYSSLYALIPYSDSAIIDIIENGVNSKQDLDYLNKKICCKINDLKRKQQYSSMKLNYNNSFIDIFTTSANKNFIISIIKPIYYIILLFFMVILFLLFSKVLDSYNEISKFIYIIALGINVPFVIIDLDFLLANKKARYHIVCIILLIVSSTCSILTPIILLKDEELVIASFILVTVVSISIFCKLIKNKHNHERNDNTNE